MNPEYFSINQNKRCQQQKRRGGTGARQRRRRQRQLQQIHRSIFLHQQQTGQYLFGGSPELNLQVAKPITVVAGSSMASRLIEANLQTTHHDVRLTFESGCNCAKMLNWLSAVEGRLFMHGTDRLILILGTNDLHVVGAEGTIHRIMCTIQSIRRLFPGIQIVWQLLQWRTKPTLHISDGHMVLNEIIRCNMLLMDLARTLHFQTIDPKLTSYHISRDNLHPTPNGSRQMEDCIRLFLDQEHQPM